MKTQTLEILSGLNSARPALDKLKDSGKSRFARAMALLHAIHPKPAKPARLPVSDVYGEMVQAVNRGDLARAKACAANIEEGVLNP